MYERVPDELKSYFRDVADHARRVDEQVSSQRELLTSVLEANLALVSVNQNEVVKKISAWAGIIAVPTFIASVEGMNFQHMPELSSVYGYPSALLLMAISVVGAGDLLQANRLVVAATRPLYFGAKGEARSDL